MDGRISVLFPFLIAVDSATAYKLSQWHVFDLQKALLHNLDELVHLLRFAEKCHLFI